MIVPLGIPVTFYTQSGSKKRKIILREEEVWKLLQDYNECLQTARQ